MDLWIELEFFLRLVLSAICGAIVGLEREKRQKSAGLRTHIIVAMASALMMIVSKYGFSDVLHLEGIDVDASRIAAGVVTAVGFIGGGVIFIRKDTAVGLTTAAGLWATVGIGITIGAGLYILGISATFLMVFIQIFMHWKRLRIVSSAGGFIVVNMTKNQFTLKDLKQKLDKDGMYIKNMTISRNEKGDTLLKATVIFSKKEPLTSIINDVSSMEYIETLDLYTIN